MHMPLARFGMLVAAAAVLMCQAAAQPLELRPIAPGAYVAPGATGSATPENGGHIVNTGVLVGTRGVIVIDPGPTTAFGQRLRVAIARVTPLPVVLLVNTHPRAEAVLANSAFAGVPVIAHPAAARFMNERCPVCLESLRAKLGETALAGTTIATPSRTAASRRTIDAAGRRLRLLPFAAASAGDLAVLDEASGVLFAGALATGRVVPELPDAPLDAWFEALQALWRTRAAQVVPGRGAVSADALAHTAAYLNALDRSVTRELIAGAELARVEAPLPLFADWPGYAEQHAANVRRAFVRAEARWLARR